MSKTRVYGVLGLIEWKPVIHVGRASFSPLFKGGQLSGFGITPATYKTSNPIEQRIIENSDYFKCKRIEHLYDLGEDDAETEDSQAQATEERVAEEQPSQPVTKEFASLGDARNYLADTFGIDKASIPNKASVVKAASANGVEIIFNE